MERRRVQRDRVRQVRFSDQLRHEGLAHGRIECSDTTEQKREHVHAAREQIIDRIEVVLDKRDVDDLNRISKKILALFAEDMVREPKA
jgi:hypothetical protein